MKKKQNEKRRAHILWRTLLVVAVMLFIFSKSLPDQDASGEESRRIMELIRPILAFFIGEENVTLHLVRKLAHLTEFCALGISLSLLSCGLGKRSVPWTILTAVLTALFDETIQIFTGRGPSVTDVWIDISGAAIGMLLVGVIAALTRRRRRT